MKVQEIRERGDRTTVKEALRARQPVLPWPDFVAELDQLERCRDELLGGPGDQGRVPLEPVQVDTISRDELAWSHFHLSAGSRLLAFRYPVVAYFEAVRAGREPDPPAPANTFAVLVRTGAAVSIHQISRLEFVVLGLLERGETLGDALAVVDSGDGSGRTALGEEPEAWIERWARRGLLRSIRV